MSIQEKWLNFKQALLGGDWLMSLLIVGVAGSSFWLGQQSVIFPNGLPQSAQTAAQAFEAGDTNPIAIEATVSAPVDQPTPPERGVAKAVTAGTESASSVAPAVATGGAYVASKNGTKYHLPWCAGAQAIKAENKIWFASKAEAEAAGYTPAANCKGI